MSKFYTVVKNGNNAEYGLDHALGWFYTEYSSEDEPIVDESTFTTGLGHGRLVALLEGSSAPKEHIYRIAMDIDPAE